MRATKEADEKSGQRESRADSSSTCWLSPRHPVHGWCPGYFFQWQNLNIVSLLPPDLDPVFSG